MCGVGTKFVLNNKDDQLLSYYLSSYLHDKHRIFALILLTTLTRQQIDAKIHCYHVNDLKKDFTCQQIDVKIQCFHVNDLKIQSL